MEATQGKEWVDKENAMDDCTERNKTHYASQIDRFVVY